MIKIFFQIIIFSLFCQSIFANEQLVFDWEAYYKGPGANYGYPCFLDVDSKGNIYVCGVSEGKPDIPGASGYVYHDIAICKFNNTGKLIWSNRYNSKDMVSDEPAGMFLCDDGVLIIGGSISEKNENNEGVILKYSYAGKLLWSHTSRKFMYRSLICDKKGNIYVGGLSLTKGSKPKRVVLAKYSPSGKLLWTKEESGASLGLELFLDESQDCIFFSDASLGTFKYLLNGERIWHKAYGEIIMGVPADVFYKLSRKSRDSFRIKFYNSNGKKINTNYIELDRIRLNRLKQDYRGNIYLWGTFETDKNASDIFICKIDYNGNRKWIRTYNNSEVDGQDFPVDIQIYKDLIYLAGQSQNSKISFGGYQLLLLKYNKNGRLLSENQFGITGSVESIQYDGQAIYVASNGDYKKGEFVLTRIAEKNQFSSGKPEKSQHFFDHLPHKQKEYAQRMFDYISQKYDLLGGKDMPESSLSFPPEILQTDIYKKWGLEDKSDFSRKEKYYIMQLPTVDQIWQMYSDIDIENLTTEEKDFLEKMHAKYGKGSINLRKENNKKGTLSQQQKIWFDLIRAVTGSDELDEKGLIFVYKMTPR